MKTYKLNVVTAFRDQHTQEKYKPGTELNVSEERALELFSSQHHLVQYISCEGEEEVNSIKAENDALKAENTSLKAEVENLTNENTSLKADVENLTNENNSLKEKNTDNEDKEQKNKNK